MPTYDDPGTLSFDAIIERSDVSGSSAFVRYPFSVADQFGVKGRVPVIATFDGAEYRGSLVTYSGRGHMILVLTEIQERIDKEPGDSVAVTVRLDTAQRTVELDTDVVDALGASGHLEQFRALSYSHQREYWLWISDAKRPETRLARVGKMIGMLGEGKTLK
jgi:small nuclear ribonucleoprotein (snRNP)-like protein